jgi:hypothetical protein
VPSRPLEYQPGSINLVGQGERLGEPERAEQEGALLAGKTFHALLGEMAIHQSLVVGQPLLNCVNRREHPRIRGGQEADDRHHQTGGVQRGGADVLTLQQLS